jgi:hypothetical protein
MLIYIINNFVCYLSPAPMRILISRMSTVLTAVVTLLFLCYTSPAFAYPVTLSWKTPIKNTDGTSLTDLEGYRVYYGTSSRNYSRSIDVGNVRTYTVHSLITGVTYFFAVTAHDTSGNTSNYSNEVSITKYKLALKSVGDGSVTSSPSGIDCGSDCSEAYKAGTVVALTAIPEADSTFYGWSGNGCGGDGQCVLTLNENITLAANFTSTDFVFILSPNGGEVLKAGSAWYIRWQSDQTMQQPIVLTKLKYTCDGGINWDVIDALPGDPGSYLWTVAYTSSTQCKIKIVLKDENDAAVCIDKSDAYFTILP